MNSPQKLLAVAAIIVLFSAAFVFRYEVTTNDRGVAYKLDRWTGQVTFLAGSTAREAVPPPAPVDWSQFKPDKPTIDEILSEERR